MVKIGFTNQSTGFCLAYINSINPRGVLLTTSDGGAAWNVDSSIYKLGIDSSMSPIHLFVTESDDSVLVSLYYYGYYGASAAVENAVYSSTNLGKT